MSHCKLHLFAFNPSTCFSHDAACLEQDFGWLFFSSFLLPHYTVAIGIKKDILHCSQHCCSNTICYLCEELNFPCLLCLVSFPTKSPLQISSCPVIVTPLPGGPNPSTSHSESRNTTQLQHLHASMPWRIFPCMYEVVGGSQCVSSRLIHLFCFPFPAYRIHVSQSTVNTLRSLNEGYEIVPRGKTELKVRRPGLCGMLHKGIFLLTEFSC